MSRALLFVGGQMFHQRIATLGLSIEEGTDNVPRDGRYYVMTAGIVDGSYRTLREAPRRYETLKSQRVPAQTEAEPVATAEAGAE